MTKKTRHILMMSGGKDSTALAIYMRDRVPGMEYVFCDTDKELPETYEYLKKIEYTLGIKIEKLRDDRGFDHWLAVYGGYLPSSNMRWCTRMLKIKPFEKYVGDDEVMMYVGRASSGARNRCALGGPSGSRSCSRVWNVLAGATAVVFGRR